MSIAVRPYRRRIGEILLSDGVVSAEQIEEALGIQKKTGELLGSVLLDMGAITESDIARTVCVQYQLPFMCLSNYEFDEKLMALFPREFLHRHKILPFDRLGDMLLVMVTEVPPETVLAEIPKLTKLNAALYVGYVSEVDKFLSSHAPLDAGKVKDAKARGARKPQHAMPLADAAPSLDVAEAEISIESVSDDDGESGVPGSGAADADDDALVFGGDKKSFLQELDSTWDSIFEGASDKPAPPAKPAPRPAK